MPHFMDLLSLSWVRFEDQLVIANSLRLKIDRTSEMKRSAFRKGSRLSKASSCLSVPIQSAIGIALAVQGLAVLCIHSPLFMEYAMGELSMMIIRDKSSQTTERCFTYPPPFLLSVHDYKQLSQTIL